MNKKSLICRFTNLFRKNNEVYNEVGCFKPPSITHNQKFDFLKPHINPVITIQKFNKAIDDCTVCMDELIFSMDNDLGKEIKDVKKMNEYLDKYAYSDAHREVPDETEEFDAFLLYIFASCVAKIESMSIEGVLKDFLNLENDDFIKKYFNDELLSSLTDVSTEENNKLILEVYKWFYSKENFVKCVDEKYVQIYFDTASEGLSPEINYVNSCMFENNYSYNHLLLDLTKANTYDEAYDVIHKFIHDLAHNIISRIKRCMEKYTDCLSQIFLYDICVLYNNFNYYRTLLMIEDREQTMLLDERILGLIEESKNAFIKHKDYLSFELSYVVIRGIEMELNEKNLIATPFITDEYYYPPSRDRDRCSNDLDYKIFKYIKKILLDDINNGIDVIDKYGLTSNALTKLVVPKL